MEVFFLNQVHMVALLSAAAWHAQSWERQGSLVVCAQQKWIFLRRQYLMEGEEHCTISRASPHMEAITSNGAPRLSPQSEWNQKKILSQSLLSVRSPAICPGMQRFMSADPHLNHYFFLCSSAQSMIRGSQGLISSFKMKKKSSCGAVYLPGFDFQIPLSTTAELIIIPYLFKSLSLTSSLYNLFVHFSLAWTLRC